MSRQNLNCRLLSASTLAITVMSAASAHAQNDRLDEIVVSGQAAALRKAIETKRNANNILDAISQDDIGRLPDLNTASALRRIPGISVQNDQGEPRFPVVRGLPSTYNRTSINGAIVASPERGTRTVPLDIIPASLVSRLEVYKTMTPDMDANAIGGTINVVTRSALEQDEPLFVYGQAYVGENSNDRVGGTLNGGPGSDKQTWRANVAAGSRFGSDAQFGIVGGFDYSIRNFEIPQVEVDDADYTEFNDAGENVGLGNGNGIVVPTNNRIFLYNNVRERIGGNLKFEWEPSEDVHFEIGGLYSQFDDDERRDENIYELGSTGAPTTPETIREQTETSGIADGGQATVGIGRFVIDRSIWNIRSGLDWEVTDRLTWNVDAVYSKGELHNPESTESFRTMADNEALYDTSGFFPRTYPLDAESFYDASRYVHTSRGQLLRTLDDEVYQIGTDLAYEFASDIPLTVKAGGFFRDNDRTEDQTFQRFTANDTYTLADVLDQSAAEQEWDGQYKMVYRIDSEAANQRFGEGAGFTGGGENISASEASEEVWAGYGMVTAELGQLTVMGGLRVEMTDWTGTNLSADDPVSGDYTSLLPGLHANYRFNEDVVVRAAYSETIGRPNMSALTSGQTVNVGTDGTITVNRSNPDLKPRSSRNFDLSLEWYVPEGLIGIGAFYKDIDNEIFTQTQTDVTLDLGDGPQIVDLTQPTNAQSGEIKGLELQVQQRLYFLPGWGQNFGISANATLLDTEFVVPTATGTRTVGFLQQPDYVANLMAYYTTDVIEVRASYNYTGKFIDSVATDTPNRDEYWKKRETVDFQARLTVHDGLTLVGEVQNLTNSSRTEVTGPGARYLQEYAEFGRTFWLGLNYAY